MGDTVRAVSSKEMWREGGFGVGSRCLVCVAVWVSGVEALEELGKGVPVLVGVLGVSIGGSVCGSICGGASWRASVCESRGLSCRLGV